MPTALVLGGGALAGGVASGLFGYFGAQDAASKQQQSALSALGLQESEFQTALQYIQGNTNTGLNFLRPFANTGKQAYKTLASLYGVGQGPNGQQGMPNWSQFLQTPAYQFASTIGNESLQNTLASQGQILSGNQLTATMNYNQGLASQQFTNVTNALASISGMGEQAAGSIGSLLGQSSGQVGSLASNAAQTMGNTTQAYGAAGASGIVGGTNAITGAIGSGTSNLLALYGLNKFLGGSSGAAANPSSYQPPNPGVFGGTPGNMFGGTAGVPYLNNNPFQTS